MALTRQGIYPIAEWAGGTLNYRNRKRLKFKLVQNRRRMFRGYPQHCRGHMPATSKQALVLVEIHQSQHYRLAGTQLIIVGDGQNRFLFFFQPVDDIATLSTTCSHWSPDVDDVRTDLTFGVSNYKIFRRVTIFFSADLSSTRMRQVKMGRTNLSGSMPEGIRSVRWRFPVVWRISMENTVQADV